MAVSRRNFLRGSSAAALGFGLPVEVFAQAPAAPAAPWDAGSLVHLLPTVSDTRMLIKASFNAPLEAPTLRVDATSVQGRMSDTRGTHWHFHVMGLQPGRPYTL